MKTTTRPNPNSPTKKEAAQEVTARRRLEAFGQNVRSFWETHRKTFCALLILHLVGISAILRANVSYIDDVRRVVSGQRKFGFGRKLADALAVLLHADTIARDISPLPQLLAVCFLCAAGCIVIHLITEKREFHLWPVIAVLPLGLSPYFLECISYKYDSPYMALSILVSVLPFLLPDRKKDLPLYGAVSALCCLAMCLLYQASSGVYPMLTALLCFHRWNKGRPVREVVQFGSVSALSYCVGVLSFNLFVMSGLTYMDYVAPPSRWSKSRKIWLYTWGASGRTSSPGGWCSSSSSPCCLSAPRCGIPPDGHGCWPVCWPLPRCWRCCFSALGPTSSLQSR